MPLLNICHNPLSFRFCNPIKQKSVDFLNDIRNLPCTRYSTADRASKI